MIILGIDPGTNRSGVVLWDTCAQRVYKSWILENEAVLDILKTARAHVMAIERFEARGMRLGDESIQTILWTGRFVQRWLDTDLPKLCEVPHSRPCYPILRRKVKMHFCGQTRAKDSNIRAALIDRFGGQDKAVGVKASPGCLHGVKSHMWPALAVAVVCEDLIKEASDAKS